MNVYLEVLADTLRIATFQARTSETHPCRDGPAAECSRYGADKAERRLPQRGR